MRRSDRIMAALFVAIVISQIFHLGEHVSQMIEIHVLGLSGANARGIIGALDIEWVHFIWNTWIIVGVIALLIAFPGNRWLWVAAILSCWHEIEHLVIMLTFLRTGLAGSPGLLSQGGMIAGGLPLARPDLHFLYNLVEVIPLIGAYLAEDRLVAFRVSHWFQRRHTAGS